MTSPPSSDDKSVGVMTIDAHEELIQQLESGQAKIKLLSVITVGAAGILVAAYFSQLLVPLTSPTKVVEVNLADPSLMAAQVFLILLGAAWMTVGILNLRFSMRMGKQVREIRDYQNQVMQRINPGTKPTS